MKVEEEEGGEEGGFTVTSIEENRTPTSYEGTSGGPVQSALPSRHKTNGRTVQAAQPSHDKTGIEIRLQLLERQLQNVRSADASKFSTAACSVILSIRWAFLKCLEKPLRNINFSRLAEHGLASSELTVSAQCDYNTFRELASGLAREHGYSDNSKRSRIAFSPSFHTIQAGSCTSDNMHILFTTLADLTSFFQIRDDNDFEAALS